MFHYGLYINKSFIYFKMKHLKKFENSSSDHPRTIPRDFFNESKLLKCMGFLALRILDNQLPDGISIKIDEHGEPFEIKMLRDGSLTVSNYDVYVNGEIVVMKTTYNSKSNFPLFCDYEGEEFLVFDDKGQFDKEFIEKFAQEDESEY